MLFFYDSGIGGLAVLKKWLSSNQNLDSNIRTKNQKIVYFADTAVFPLGDKNQIEAKSAICNSLKTKIPFELTGHLVLACNSASSLQIQTSLKPNKELVIINIIDETIKHLQSLKNYPNLLVLGTNLTKTCGYLSNQLDQLGVNYQFLDTGLAKFIENQDQILIGQEILRLKEQINPGFQPQLILLACTHYIFEADRIQKIFNLPILSQDNILAKSLYNLGLYPNNSQIRFLASGEPPLTNNRLKNQLNLDVNFNHQHLSTASNHN